MAAHPSRRSYARAYEAVQRRASHEFLEAAVERAGGRVLWSSGPAVAPLYLGIEDPDGSPLGVMAYAFFANKKVTKNRPADEHRLQIRYGDVNSSEWRSQQHDVGFDPASVDLTVIVGAHTEADLIVALDPVLYDPLPLGISVFFKDDEVDQATRSGWHVWERDNISGVRRDAPRAQLGLETILAFAPERLFDYLRLERQAQALGLDPPLRYQAALRAQQPDTDMSTAHELEQAFGLSGPEILDLIRERARLSMAVRGGVAEHHMGKVLAQDRDVATAEVGHQEGPPDYFVTLTDGRDVTVEVKNASPKTYADGTPKVEVQKTRASQGDPASRLYGPSAFDVLAACMYGPTGAWTFKFKRSELLTPHTEYEDRFTPLQRIDDSWSDTLTVALDA